MLSARLSQIAATVSFVASGVRFASVLTVGYSTGWSPGLSIAVENRFRLRICAAGTVPNYKIIGPLSFHCTGNEFASSK
jgi:hypothetical protein